MRCRRVRDLLFLHAGGDLGPAVARRVATHLEGCGDCRGELRDLSRARQRLFVLKGGGSRAPDLWPELRERLPERSRLRRGRPWRIAGVAAVLVATALLLAPLGGPEPAADPVPAPVPPLPTAAASERTESRYVLVEVGPAEDLDRFEGFPSVGLPEPRRRTWDDF